MNKLINWVVVLLLLGVQKTVAQDVPKGLELMELIKLAEVYRTSPDLSFDIQFTYADSANAGAITEQVDGKYKIHEGKYWGIMDSVEFMQGGMYNMAVYHRDSVMVIADRQEYTSVLQLPLMDSLFREANVADMSVLTVNDSIRRLRIVFNPNSPYRSYELEYNSFSYLIQKVKYFLLDTSGEAAASSGVVCVAMLFANYSFNVIPDDFFKESRFIYRFANEIKQQPTYAGFRLIMNISQQE